MEPDLYYHSLVRKALSCAVVLGCFFVTIAQAQIHGVPASVTSMGFGRGPNPGIPASVTSLGPHGFGGGNGFGMHFRPNPNSFPNPNFRHNRFRREPFLTYYPAVMPIYPYDYSDYSVDPAPAQSGDNYGQPKDVTVHVVFDNKPDRASAHAASSETTVARAALPPPAPLPDEPGTVLVFKDGRQLEVKNYAIQGDLLYDLTGGRPHKIALADLDLAATQKQNDDRGVDFQLPAHVGGN